MEEKTIPDSTALGAKETSEVLVTQDQRVPEGLRTKLLADGRMVRLLCSTFSRSNCKRSRQLFCHGGLCGDLIIFCLEQLERVEASVQQSRGRLVRIES